MFGIAFAHIAWQQVVPEANGALRQLLATEQAVASQSELYWEVKPGRDFRAAPDEPGQPRAPRFQMRLSLGYEGPEGTEQLHIGGTDTGMWGEPGMLVYPLLHLSHMATFDGVPELRVPPDYLEQLKNAPASYYQAPDGANEVEGILQQLDKPLDYLAVSWLLAERQEVDVAYSPYLEDFAVVPPLGSYLSFLGTLFSSLVILLPAFAFVAYAVTLMFLGSSKQFKGRVILLLFMTLPIWSSQLNKLLPLLGDKVADNTLRLGGMIEREYPPDYLRVAGDPLDDYVSLRVEPEQSRLKPQMDFLALDRAGRQFDHIEAVYEAIYDDITKRIVTATDAELLELIGTMRPRKYCSHVLGMAFLEGMHAVAQDINRPKNVREGAACIVRSIARSISYGYYQLAPKAKTDRMRAYLPHESDPETHQRMAERIDWILEYAYTEDAGY